MVMRIFRATAKTGKYREFDHFFCNVAIPLIERTEGIIQVLPGAPRTDSPNEFSWVMIWKDLASLRALVADAYQSAHVDPTEAELVEPRMLKHYELVE